MRFSPIADDMIRYLPEILVFKSGMIVLVLTVCSCSQSPEKKYQDVKDSSAKSWRFTKSPSSFEDTFVIEHASAVFYTPDSIQLEKIKGSNEKRVYETLTHDCHYMIQNARNVIRQYWPRIPVIEVAKARYLLFVKKDKTSVCIDLNKRNSLCGLYIFDVKKDPEPVDMPNVNSFMGFYFDQ